MSSATMREVAMKREVELLWHAAESERRKAQALSEELAGSNAALRQALTDLREASEEIACLKGEFRQLKNTSEESVCHFRELLFDAQSKAAVEERAMRADFTKRLATLDERQEILRQKEVLLETVAVELQAEVEKMCGYIAGTGREFADAIGAGADDLVARVASTSRSQVQSENRVLQSFRDELSRTIANAAAVMRDAANLKQQNVMAPPAQDSSPIHLVTGRPLAESQLHLGGYATHCLTLDWCHAVDAHWDTISCLFSDAVAELFRQTIHSAQHEVFRLAASAVPPRRLPEDTDTTARLVELEEAISAAEKRLQSRDSLIVTLKRRAAASEDQVTQLQEENHLQEQTTKERERQLHVANARLQDQQNVLTELRNALHAREAEISKIRDEGGSLPASERHDHRMALSELTPESVGRQGATAFLRDQLSHQMDLLHRIEESEQRAANERATHLFSNAMHELFAMLTKSVLHDRAEYLEWVGCRMHEERLYLRERLVEAAEQLAEMERHRQRLEELVEGTYKSSNLTEAAMLQPFHLVSIQHVVEVALAPPPVAMGGSAPFGGALVSSGLFPPLSGRATSIAVEPSSHMVEQHCMHLAVALGSLFMEIKLEFNQLLLQAHRSLLRMFWALAPKERASSHVRVHILEGALAVSEAQRIQSVTVAQWLEEQCLAARDSLSELLRLTSASIVGWQGEEQHWQPDGLMLSIEDSPTNRPRGFTGASAMLLRGNGHASTYNASLAAPSPTSGEFHHLQESLATSDRRAARDVLVAHQVCDRLLEMVSSLQSRLLDSEMSTQHALGDTAERGVEAEELRLQMERQVLTHALEQHIADDAVGMLRDILQVERREALALIQSLLVACAVREAAICDHSKSLATLRTTLRSVLMLAQYMQGAFESSLELQSVCMIRCAQWVRTALVPTPQEVAFALITVHWEFGKALEEAANDVRMSFSSVVAWVKGVHDENFYLRRELGSAASTLNRVAEERLLERKSLEAFQDFVRHGLEDAFDSQASALWGHVLSLREVTWDSVKQHSRRYEEVQCFKVLTEELRSKLFDSEKALDEHRVALASTSAAVTSIDNVLAERLGSLRERELEVSILKTRQQEHESLITSLRAQIVTYHEMLVDAGSERDVAADSFREKDSALRTQEQVVADLREELGKLQHQLDEERGAHRNTIRTIADTLVPGGSAVFR